MSKLKKPAQNEGCSFLVIAILLAIPFLYGAFQITNTLFVEFPYVLSGNNPQKVKYDSITISISADHEIMRKNAKGTKLIDGTMAIVDLSHICEHYQEMTCAKVEEKIKAEGLIVETYFYKNNNHAMVIYPDTPEELNRIKWNYIFWYFVLMIPLIILVLIWKGLHIYRYLVPSLIFIIFTSSAFAQSTSVPRLDSFPVYTGISKTQKASIYEYAPAYSLKRQNLDTIQIPLKYPEEVLLAFLCAKDNNWVDFVYEKGEAEKRYKQAAHYEALASVDPNEIFLNWR